MRKIPSLYMRNYDGDRLVRDEVVQGSEWVLAGEGVATPKWDGSAVMIDADGNLFKRYDRKRDRKTGNYKAPPPGWIACEDEPNEHTGHWPGWVPVGGGPEDRWYREARRACPGAPSGTYEAIGPHFQGNPHNTPFEHLVPHGKGHVEVFGLTFDGIRAALEACHHEGIVWHHPDGRMVKIKRKDFGLPWPIATTLERIEGRGR